MTRSVPGLSNGPINVRLTLPFLPAGALGRVSANSSWPGGPDRAGPRPRTGLPNYTKPHRTALAKARGCVRWLLGRTSGEPQPAEYSARAPPGSSVPRVEAAGSHWEPLGA